MEINFPINIKLFAVLCGTSKSILVRLVLDNCACVLAEKLISDSKPSLKSAYFIRYVMMLIGRVRHGICVCVIDEQRNRQASNAVLINFSYLLFCFVLHLSCCFVSLFRNQRFER